MLAGLPALMRRLALILIPVLAFVLGMANSAQADCHGDGPDSGSGTTNTGPTTSSQSMFWRLADPEAGSSATNSDAVLSDYCIDSNVDWITVAGHYDDRTARNCDDTNASTRGGSYFEPNNFNGRLVEGLQKAAGCYYNQYSTATLPNPHYAGCQYIPPSVNGCGFAAASARQWNDLSHMVWLRRQNGTIDFNDGGLEHLPDA